MKRMSGDVIEVSEMFWDVVHQLGSGDLSHCPLLAELQAHTFGLRPIMTDEAIALPAGCWRPAPAEYVYDTLGAMFDAVLHMYDTAAAALPESAPQRCRRVRLRAAVRRMRSVAGATVIVTVY